MLKGLRKSPLKKTILLLVLCGVLLGAFFYSGYLLKTDKAVIPEVQAFSCCDECSTCLEETTPDDLSAWVQNWIAINMHIFITFYLHRLMWFDWEYWQVFLLPVFMNTGEQLTAVGTQQMMIIGTFMDAQQTMKAQKLLQTLHAKAHKDYQLSSEICEFGTRVKSMAASERKGEMGSLVMSSRFISRMTQNTATASNRGSSSDISARVAQFRKIYCDINDNNATGSLLCPDTSNIGNLNSKEKARLNKDVDYVRTVYRPWTLNADLTAPGTPSTDQEDLLALASNLYGYDSFEHVMEKAIENNPNNTANDAQRAYMDMRSVIAKENVAHNSFAALMAMKSAGSGGNANFLKNYLKQLGASRSEADTILGDNPSYYAQMEILTKTAYQTPAFYTNLYDTPVNVERKGVAMQAIGLIQKFDLLKSYLRTEISLSVLLELSVTNMQEEIEDAIRTIDSSTNQ